MLIKTLNDERYIMKKELLLGCGSCRTKKLFLKQENKDWSNLTTLDMTSSCNPDVVHDLNITPWPFEDNSFDEIHMYEVLEHLGRQGDFESFFAHFAEIYRILKPEGHLFGTTPSIRSRWLWGDPGHTRYIGPESMFFLSQKNYDNEVGRTQMTDYRFMWKGDLELVDYMQDDNDFQFVLKAIKPSRISV
jgi:hypothetical protein